MPIPDFNDSGDLPVGVHVASLAEVIERFGHGSQQRQSVASRLERVWDVARSTGCISRFIVFGSFVTDTSDPNDVDVMLVMDDAFDASQLGGATALLFDHQAADAHFGASVFWIRRLAILGDVQDMIECWQGKRGGGRRGIIEMIESHP
jgi:hypothetical protein